MTKQEAVEYLEHILETWSVWENHHKKLCDAIEILLEDAENSENSWFVLWHKINIKRFLEKRSHRLYSWLG